MKKRGRSREGSDTGANSDCRAKVAGAERGYFVTCIATHQLGLDFVVILLITVVAVAASVKTESKPNMEEKKARKPYRRSENCGEGENALASRQDRRTLNTA